MPYYFDLKDALRFSHIAYGSAVVNVFLYFILGDYKEIHYRRLSSEVSRVMIVQLILGYLISAVLYWMKGDQFSRVWLILYIFISWALIICKRIIFNELSDILFGKYIQKEKVLVLGGNDLAKRYIKGQSEIKGTLLQIEGYIADRENIEIPKYLGAMDVLKNVLEQGHIDELVIAEENIDKKHFKEILEICHSYNLKTYIIPMFNDYLTGDMNFIFREDIPGLCLIPVDIMRTDDILGVNIAVTNMEQTIDNIAKNIENWRGEYICVSNVHTTVMAHDDITYRSIQNEAVMALPDGGPLSHYSRSRGNNTAMRVTGPDLMHEVLKISCDRGWRHFFYGSDEKTLYRLKEAIEREYSGALISGMISPPYRALTDDEDKDYVRKINEAKPDFVWVGLGAPKQEIWMYEHRHRINAIMIGVGAAFDYESGNIKRAPLWMQRSNLEWLYRLVQQPRRLFGRYFFTNIRYLWLTRK